MKLDIACTIRAWNYCGSMLANAVRGSMGSSVGGSLDIPSVWPSSRESSYRGIVREELA